MATLAATICADEGAILDDSLVFEDKGVSAFRGKNAVVGALGEFLRLVECGRITRGSVLIFENIDRMSRAKLPVAMKLFLGILEAGIVIWTARPKRRYTMASVSDLAGIIEPLVQMVRAHEESQRKSEILREMWAEKKRQARQGVGIGRQAPAWVEWDGTNYVLRHPHAATIRDVCRMALDGLGAARISYVLQADKDRYPPITRSGWNKQYVRKVLHSRALIGEYQPGGRDEEEGRRVFEGKPIPGYYPPLVTEQEWWQIQAAVEGRRRRAGRPGKGEANLFTGRLYEARSKQRLQARPAPTATGKRYVYLMPARPSGQGSPRIRADDTIPYEPLEECILRMLDELRPENLREGKRDVERQQNIAHLTGEVVALDHREKLIQQELADPVLTGAEQTSLLETLRAVARKKAEAAHQLERLKLEGQSGREETLGEVKSLVVMMRKSQGDERQHLRQRLKARIGSLVESIWVLAQVETRRRKVLHVQIFLRGGTAPLYATTIPPDAQWGTVPKGLCPWDLLRVDLRTWQGDVAGTANDTASA